MKKLYFALLGLVVPCLVMAQSFTNSSSLLNSDYNSGGCVGVTDMNNDGIDDIIILDQSNNLIIEYSFGESFSAEDYGSVSGSSQWGFAVGDCDNDGHNDVYSGGAYDGVHFMKIYSPGNAELVSLDNGNMFMQGANMADINNDGFLDAFGCHDDATSRIWINNGEGALEFDENVIELESYDFSDYPNTDHSGNYGSTFTDIDDDGDIDLFIAKCRQFVDDPNDPRRINQLWINDGEGNFTEEADDRGLVFYHQSWTADFADIDNDGDFDALITNHSTSLKMFENDGNGYFTEITEEAGLGVEAFFLQAKMVDFDNDGFVDLVYSGGEEGYFKNNGDGTFSEIANVFPYNDTMHSLAIGDLNKDGFLDLYASYGQVYVSPDNNNDDILWMNDTNDNNWIVFDLEGIESNKNAVGAKVKIYGDFGVQVREVRAGESYGIVNTFHCHFGLGSATEIDYAEVIWPAGSTTTIDDPTVNDYNVVLEAPCALPSVEITLVGENEICPGETASIVAPDGYVYSWSNGAETSEIEVSESGVYSLIVYNDEGCAGTSNSITITVVEPVAPVISVIGDMTFCEGESTTLSSTDAVSYDWYVDGNAIGAEEQSLTIIDSGVYSVQVTDICEAPISSETVTIAVLESPDTPVVDDITLDEIGSATFTGTSENLLWYDAVDATTELAQGSSYTTPELTTTTEYWVEDVIYHGGDEFTGGKDDVGVTGQYHNNNNFWLIFDAYQDMNLNSVKVFSGNAGTKGIEVIDAFGNTIAEGDFDVPEGESVVELDFFIPAGVGYGLRSSDDNPQLWRDAPPSEMNYPYYLGTLGAVVSSSVTGDNTFNYYYFFYDWTVSTPLTACYSDRIMVTATVTGIEDIDFIESLSVYPNPANDFVSIALDLTEAKDLSVEILDLSGRIVQNLDLTTASGSNVFQLDVSGLSSGVYLLNMNFDGEVVSEKLFIK